MLPTFKMMANSSTYIAPRRDCTASHSGSPLASAVAPKIGRKCALRHHSAIHPLPACRCVCALCRMQSPPHFPLPIYYPLAVMINRQHTAFQLTIECLVGPQGWGQTKCKLVVSANDCLSGRSNISKRRTVAVHPQPSWGGPPKSFFRF